MNFLPRFLLLQSIDARRSAALDSRPSEELPGTVVPTQNTVLKQKLDALIEEASKSKETVEYKH